VFITGILSFVTFILDIDEIDNRANLVTTLFLTMVTFKFVIYEDLPRVAYLTTLDYYILQQFLILLEQGILQACATIISRNSNREYAEYFDFYSFLFTSCHFVILQIWMGYKAIKNNWKVKALGDEPYRIAERSIPLESQIIESTYRYVLYASYIYIYYVLIL
jgi:hypothetical protein